MRHHIGVATSDNVPLGETDFRRERTLLSPAVFAWPDGEPEEWPPPDDVVDKRSWDHIMGLATHVALQSTSYAGSVIDRLHQLYSDWVFSWPAVGTAPYIEYACLIAGEEFDALVFNTVHGFYRQAIGCLRVALETLAIAAGFAVIGDAASFEAWEQGRTEGKFGAARVRLRDSPDGRAIDAAVKPRSVFGDSDTAWLNARYKRLCDYAHSRAGNDNGGFWESNGPLFVPRALDTVERELRETLAICYLLQRLAWPSYKKGQGQSALLTAPLGDWSDFEPMLKSWLL